jgi:hypothetical protein
LDPNFKIEQLKREKNKSLIQFSNPNTNPNRNCNPKHTENLKSSSNLDPNFKIEQLKQEQNKILIQG